MNDGLELRAVDGGRHFRAPGSLRGGLIAASSDRRLIAGLLTQEKGRPGSGAMLKVDMVRVWEAATGMEVTQVAAGPMANLALAANGRYLITTDAAFLHVWDLATSKERRRWALPAAEVDPRGTTIVSDLKMFPDGRRALTVLFDGTALIWDFSSALGTAEPPARSPNEGTMAAWWTDLAGTDARKAYAAVWRLAEAPGATVPFLRRHVRPVPEPDVKKVGRYIADLDSETFAVREKASRELENLGNAAAPTLREALTKSPSLEVRRRVEQLLSRSVERVPPPETLRRLRALHVLEQIGSPDARRFLAELAEGAAYAEETQDAKAALRRLSAGFGP
jgi:hypothetical protein